MPLTAEELTALAEAWRANARDATVEARDEIFEKYGAVVARLDAKGGDPALLDSLRTYRTAIYLEETATLEPQEIFDNVLAWLVSPEGGIEFALRVAVAVGALLGLLIVAKVVRAWSRRMFGRVPNLSKLLQGFLAMVVYWLVVAVGLMLVLAALGVNVTPLFALVGGASFIAAFALQDTLGNLAAGLMIMINRPFDEATT